MRENKFENNNELSRRSFLIASLLALPAATLAAAPEQNWPEFRGAGGSGVAEGYPTRTTWNADAAVGKLEGVLWRAEIPGLGHSSPIIWGNRIFVATAVWLAGKAPLGIGYYGDTKAAPDNDEQRWMILCFDKKSGKRLWERTLRTSKPAAARHEKATHANTTLSTDGKHLIAFIGSEGLYCLDLKGKLLWSQDLGVINISKYGIGWGYAGSAGQKSDGRALSGDPGNFTGRVLFSHRREPDCGGVSKRRKPYDETHFGRHYVLCAPLPPWRLCEKPGVSHGPSGEIWFLAETPRWQRGAESSPNCRHAGDVGFPESVRSLGPDAPLDQVATPVYF